MDITINGERRAVPAPQTVETLLESLGIDGRKVAVELNVEIVPRSAYGAPLAIDRYVHKDPAPACQACSSWGRSGPKP